MGRQDVIRRAVAGAAVALAAACSHLGEPVQEPAYRLADRRASRAVVALPALLGLPVDAWAQRLGPARPVPGAVQAVLNQLPGAAIPDSLRFFRCRSLEVLVSYDPGTGRCTDLLLLGPDEDLLMQRAGLSAEAAGYLLLPVFWAHRPTQQLGLREVPLGPAKLQ